MDCYYQCNTLTVFPYSPKLSSDEVRYLRTSSMNLVDALSIYDLENDAQIRVDVAEAILNNFEKEPFLELR